jgi:predicted N-acetyltransferase YhbS
MPAPEVTYQCEEALDPEEFIDVLKRSTLAERRPVNDMARIKLMCQNGNLIVTARIAGKLVGIARSLSDFAFCTYLSDLAVDQAYQRMGIGIRLIKETKRHTPQAELILLAAPAAEAYYPKTGMTRFTHTFLLDNIDDLKV